MYIVNNFMHKMNKVVIQNNLPLYRKQIARKVFQKNLLSNFLILFYLMKKSLFFLFLIAFFAYLGFSSCDAPNPPESCGKTVQWDNRNTIYFSPIRLSVTGQFYRVGWGGNYSMMLVDPNSPIMDFYDVFMRPVTYDGQYISAQSSIKTTTTLNSCYNSDQAAYIKIDQTYKNVDHNQEVNHSLPSSAITSGSTTTMSFNATAFAIWGANRDLQYQNNTFEVISGNYETREGQLVKLLWTKTFTSSNTTDMSYSTTATSVTANAGSLNIMGAAINVTPDRPFIHHIYLDGALKPCTLENVSMPNKLLTLKVK